MMPSQLHPVRIAMLATLLIAGASPDLPAAVLAPASFQESIIYPSVEMSGNDAVAETLSVLRLEDWRSVDAAASTVGGAWPTAAARMALSVDAPGYWRDYLGGAGGSIDYHWSLVQTGGEPYGGLVPVDIRARGYVRFIGRTADAGLTSLFASATFSQMGPGQYRAFEAVTPADEHGLPSLDEAAFDASFTAMIEPGRVNRVQLQASGGGWVTMVGSFAFEAWVDPIMFISPDFDRRGDFTLLFSEGIQPVPIPAAAPLLLGGLAALGALARRRRRRFDAPGHVENRTAG